MMTRPRIVSIEGNIGAGKTTLVNRLKELYKNSQEVIFAEEPVDIWGTITQDGKNILELFYENQEKYSFAFQILAYTTRRQLLKNLIQQYTNTSVKTIVMERSLEADKNIFAKLLHQTHKIEDSMYKVYELMSEDGLKEFGADGIIWLDTSPEQCIERIANRNRDGEDKISLAYLNEIDVCHREWLSADTGFVHRLSTNDSFDEEKLDVYLIHR